MDVVLEVTQNKKQVLSLCLHESHISMEDKAVYKEIIVLSVIIMWQYNKGYSQSTFECYKNARCERDALPED